MLPLNLSPYKYPSFFSKPKGVFSTFDVNTEIVLLSIQRRMSLTILRFYQKPVKNEKETSVQFSHSWKSTLKIQLQK